MSIITKDERRGADVPVVREVCATRVATLVTPTAGPYAALKLSFDYTLALFLLVLTAPVVLLAMLAIKLTSRGPAVYMQTRLGRAGMPFVIYKLRTMAHQCESLTGAQWCVTNDPRVTKLGRILRKTHIDELPQLWNVLKGEMSLIGPRPERPEFLPQLEQAIPHYKARLLVRPGVTGLAQVQWPADTTLASVRTKLAYDLYYVRHIGLWLDCRILLSTAAKLAALPFHVTRRVFGFPTRAVVEQEYKLLSPA
jgi:lipopolysaccharide/colanic/teichoic acid biosynthesis glycosyltransferase